MSLDNEGPSLPRRVYAGTQVGGVDFESEGEKGAQVKLGESWDIFNRHVRLSGGSGDNPPVASLRPGLHPEEARMALGTLKGMKDEMRRMGANAGQMGEIISLIGQLESAIPPETTGPGYARKKPGLEGIMSGRGHKPQGTGGTRAAGPRGGKSPRAR